MTQQASPSHLVYTKLNQPRLAAQLIERKRLYTALDLHWPLTIVVAPAGYGKTTLVSHWAAQCGLRCAWLSLDPGDNEISVFADYFLAATARLFPEVVHNIAVGPQHGTATSFLAVARKLADALDEVDERFAVVLDDYHFVGEPDIHRFLAELLRFPPHGLSLVLASRIDPPLPLAAMRARAQLAEVRTHDLRFTTDEIAEYLQQALNTVVDAKTLGVVEESTEGWIAGLHLAALYLQNQANTAEAAAKFGGSNRVTVDYLAIEVLARQGLETQSFLVQTSFLRRMCPALCDAILGAQQSRRILDYLDSQNLFITTLDDHQQWYRYHHLFQQLLVSRLRATHSRAAIAALYAAASRWCAEQDLVDEAITYAVAADNVAGAIALIESHRHATMNAEQWQQLERWLNLLPRQHVDESPQLLVLEAWILHKRQRLTEIPARLDLAEALLKETRLPDEVQRHLCSEIDALRSQQYFSLGNATLAYLTAQKALDTTPLEHSGVRGVAWVFLAGGLFVSHGLPAALKALANAHSNGRAAHSSEHSRILIVKCLLFWMAAELPNLKRAADELLRYAERHELPESTIWARYFCGCACYQQNDLKAAGDHFLAVIHSQHIAPGFALIEGSFGLALALQAQGDTAGANAAAAAVLDYAQQTGNSAARQAALAFGAYLALLQNRLDEAFDWTVGAVRSFTPAPMPTFFAPPLATAAILIRQGTQAALNEAEHLLQQMETYLAASHIDRYRIEVLALQSLLYAKRGQRSQSSAVLEEAVRLAQPGGMQRVFLDLGRPLHDLLLELNLGGLPGAFVRQLGTGTMPASPAPVAAVPASPGSETVQHIPPTRVQPRHPDLIELLTNREFEVLQLLALRLTNKEIAHTLGISTGTVKQHTINLFRKLHVENRREAIVQARAMGFQIETPYPL